MSRPAASANLLPGSVAIDRPEDVPLVVHTKRTARVIGVGCVRDQRVVRVYPDGCRRASRGQRRC